MSEFEWNIIIGVGGFIMTVGLLSVLITGFGVHKYPKKWDEKLKARYVPKLLRKKDNVNKST